MTLLNRLLCRRLPRRVDLHWDFPRHPGRDRPLGGWMLQCLTYLQQSPWRAREHLLRLLQRQPALCGGDAVMRWRNGATAAAAAAAARRYWVDRFSTRWYLRLEKDTIETAPPGTRRKGKSRWSLETKPVSRCRSRFWSGNQTFGLNRFQGQNFGLGPGSVWKVWSRLTPLKKAAASPGLRGWIAPTTGQDCRWSKQRDQSCPWIHFVWPDPTQPISWLTRPDPTQYN